jgi:hypothetical protein
MPTLDLRNLASHMFRGALFHWRIRIKESKFMRQREKAETQNRKTLALDSGSFPPLRHLLHHRRHFHKAVSVGFLTLLTIGFTSSVFAQQEPVPFEVANPKHKKWSSEEAGKIYYSACELLARAVRPEKPPRLHPRFLLVLGANDNEVLRTDATVEIHLKSWNADKFAEAMVMVAAREVLQRDDLTKIARQSVSFAQSTISVDRLAGNH